MSDKVEFKKKIDFGNLKERFLKALVVLFIVIVGFNTYTQHVNPAPKEISITADQLEDITDLLKQKLKVKDFAEISEKEGLYARSSKYFKSLVGENRLEYMYRNRKLARLALKELGYTSAEIDKIERSKDLFDEEEF